VYPVWGKGAPGVGIVATKKNGHAKKMEMRKKVKHAKKIKIKIKIK